MINVYYWLFFLHFNVFINNFIFFLDFIPAPKDDISEQNLIVFDDLKNTITSGSVLNSTEKKAKVKSSPLSKTGSKKKANLNKKDLAEGKVNTDPFGFVNKEMEKLQVKTKHSKSNSPSMNSDEDIKSKTENATPKKTRKNLNENSRNSSSPGSPSRTKSKSNRSASLHDARLSQSPTRTSRGRSPSASNVKSKVKEAWAKKSSDSQEF